MPEIPAWSAAEWAMILGAIGAFLGSIVASGKVLAEIAEIRVKVYAAEGKRDETHAAAQAAAAQLVNNGGTSIRDAIDRIEGNQAALRAEVARVREAVGDVKSDVCGVKRDVGRLADQDTTDRTDSNKAHERLDSRIDWLCDTILGRRRAMLEPEHDPNTKGTQE